MRQFDYLRPRDLPEALSLLDEREPHSCHVLAGGTDVIVMMQEGKLRPAALLDISALPQLDYVSVEAGRGARIGAMASIRSLEKSEDLCAKYPVIGDAVRWFGGMSIRNMATVGGNLARGNPSADLPPALLVLGAQLRLASKAGDRLIPAEEFFVRPGVTVLEPNELLVEVILPEPPAGFRSAYHKQAPRSVDLSTVGIGVALQLDGVGPQPVCSYARLALAGAAPVPLRVKRAEEAMTGRTLDDDCLAEVAAMVAEEAAPRQDSLRAAPAYRRRLLRSLTSRVIRRAACDS